MKAFSLTLIAAAMLAILLLLGSRACSGPAVDHAAAPGGTGPAATTEGATGRRAPDPHDAPERSSMPVAAVPARLLVRVRRADGSLAAGIPVLVAPKFVGDAWRDENAAATDARGEAAFELLPGTYRCRTAQGGTAETLALPPGGTTVELRLPAGAHIQGRVADTAGRPVAGAEILLLEPDDMNRGQVAARSNARGEFVIADLTGDRSIAARHADYAPSAPQFVAASSAPVLIILHAAHGRVQGLVVDTAGQPVADALVLAGGDDAAGRGSGRGYDPPPQLVRSDARGRFTTPPLPLGPVQVRVQARGFGPALATATVRNGDSDPLRIVLERAACVHGVVRGADDSPAGGALVWSGVRAAFGCVWTRADEAGAYRLEGLPVGPVQVTAFRGAGEQQTQRAQLGPGDDVRLDFALPTGASVRGRLIDHEGGPLARWRVTATDLARGVTGDADTDETGSFLVAGLLPGTVVDLAARRPGRDATSFADAILAAVPVDGPPVEFQVPDPRQDRGALRGTIVGPEGKGCAAVLELVHEERRQVARYATAGDGSFRIDGIPAGHVLVDIRHVDHPRRRERAEIAAGAETDLGRLELGAGGAVFGKLAGPDDRPVTGVTIYVLDGDDRDAGQADCSSESYRTPLLPPGRYTLLVQADGMRPARIPVAIRPHTDLELPIVLAEGVMRHLQVTAPAPDDGFVTVVLFDEQRGEPQEKESGVVWRAYLPLRAGLSEIECWLAPGRYRVSARDDRGRAGAAELTVAFGAADVPVPIALR